MKPAETFRDVGGDFFQNFRCAATTSGAGILLLTVQQLQVSRLRMHIRSSSSELLLLLHGRNFVISTQLSSTFFVHTDDIACGLHNAQGGAFASLCRVK